MVKISANAKWEDGEGEIYIENSTFTYTEEFYNGDFLLLLLKILA